MKWATREHPKTDRIACPWLIRRFIDPEAEIHDVPADQVLAVAQAPTARRAYRLPLGGMGVAGTVSTEVVESGPLTSLRGAPSSARHS